MGSFGKSAIISYDGRVGIIYARVSSKRQAEEGTGLQSQETRCKLFLESKQIPYEKSFLDSYSGGGDFMDRPKMRELIEYIDTHPHKKFVIVFDDISRFARDVKFHIQLKALLLSKGAIIECLNFKFEDTPESELAEYIFATFAQYHRTNNKRQVIQKQQARLFSGYRPFHAVLGYTKTKNAIHGKLDTPNKDSQYVKEALEGFATKRFIHKIDVAIFLQQNGVIKKVQKPEKAIKTVDKLLREVFYAGYIEFLPWNVSRRLGHHEALISIETYNQNQRRLNAKESTYIRLDIREDFELRGLVNCATCGQKYTGSPSTSKTGKKHNYYKCNNKNCSFYGKSVPSKDIHDKFAKLLQNVKANKGTINLAMRVLEDVWHTEMNQITQNKTNLVGQKEDIERNLSKFSLEAVNTDNMVLKKQYEKQVEKLSNDLEPIEALLTSKIDYQIPCRTSQEEVKKALENPYTVWKNYNVRQKQRFYNFIFDGNLNYDKILGYRTPEYTLPITLFREIEGAEPTKVEMAGIEPASKKFTK